MRQNIYLKSTIRQPLRTLLLLLLIGVISFAFVSRAVEYLVVQRETDRLSTYYRAIGSLEPLDTDNYFDISEAAEIIAQSPFVAYTDLRRYGSGEMKGIYNADVDGAFNHDLGEPFSHRFGNSDVLVYGKVTAKSDVSSDKMGYFTISFMVDSILTGYPEYVAEEQTIKTFFRSNSDVYESLIEGQRYFIRAMFDPRDFGRYDWLNARYRMTLIPLCEDGPWFLEVAPGEEVDLNDPELAELKHEVASLQVNQHAMSVKGSSDMSAMQSVQESAQYYFLTEGRWLNREDELTGNSVCVVHKDFAEIRDLSLGDEITLTLRPFKLPYSGYMTVEEDWQNWQDYPTHELTCEIVGLFGRSIDQLTISSNEIFIPNSSFPAEFAYQDEENGLYYSSFSFVLNSSMDQDAFLVEYQKTMADQGLMIRFEENNSREFWAAAIPMKHSTATNAAIFSGVLVLTLVLVVFLYLLQRRRDFAILRALGVPKRKAVRQMLLPINLVGGMGIIAGGIPSWRYALDKAAETLSALPTPAGAATSTGLDPLWLAGLSVGILALLLLFIWIGTISVAQRPALELLQGVSAQKRKRDKSREEPREILNKDTNIETAPTVSEKKTKTEEAINEKPHLGKGVYAALLRYVLRYIYRAPLKSLLTVAVALGFMLTLGWMRWTVEKNTMELDRLYVTQTVEGEIVQSNSAVTHGGAGIINSHVVDTILESGFVQSTYLEASSYWFFIDFEEMPSFLVLAFDRPEIYFTPEESRFYTSSGHVIVDEYAEGWDECFFSENWPAEETDIEGVPAVIPAWMLRQMGCDLGDTIRIQKITFDGDGKVVRLHVVGQSDNADRILVPLSAMDWMDGKRLRYGEVQFVFDPARNRELPECKLELEELVSQSDAGTRPLRFILWDEELQSVIKPLEENLSLMAILYPVTIVLSVLIAFVLCLLLVMQNAKDAAILRVLGTIRPHVRVVLTGHQAFLSLFGLVLGLVGLAILQRDPAAMLSSQALVSAGLYLAGALLGSLIGAIFVTRRKPLELLQVKE